MPIAPKNWRLLLMEHPERMMQSFLAENSQEKYRRGRKIVSSYFSPSEGKKAEEEFRNYSDPLWKSLSMEEIFDDE